MQEIKILLDLDYVSPLFEPTWRCSFLVTVCPGIKLMKLPLPQ